MFESVANGNEIMVLRQGSTTLTVKVTVWLAVACCTTDESADKVREIEVPISPLLVVSTEICLVAELTVTP